MLETSASRSILLNYKLLLTNYYKQFQLLTIFFIAANFTAYLSDLSLSMILFSAFTVASGFFSIGWGNPDSRGCVTLVKIIHIIEAWEKNEGRNIA